MNPQLDSNCCLPDFRMLCQMPHLVQLTSQELEAALCNSKTILLTIIDQLAKMKVVMRLKHHIYCFENSPERNI